MYEVAKTVFFTLGGTLLGLGGIGLLSYFYEQGRKEGIKQGAKISNIEGRMLKMAEILAETD